MGIIKLQAGEIKTIQIITLFQNIYHFQFAIYYSQLTTHITYYSSLIFVPLSTRGEGQEWVICLSTVI